MKGYEHPIQYCYLMDLLSTGYSSNLLTSSQLRNVSLSFGQNKMLDDFSYDFNKGDRIGIVGRNGVGSKSKLLFLWLVTNLMNDQFPL